jgi:hypothetical protein
MFFLGQIGLGWVRGQSKVALKKKGALFGHSSGWWVGDEHGRYVQRSKSGGRESVNKPRANSVELHGTHSSGPERALSAG